MIGEGPFELADRSVDYTVAESATVFTGRVWDVVRDSVVLPSTGETVVRDYVRHTGAVAVAALDDAGRILLIRQYRHPVRTHEVEIPAGLLDVPGEDPLAAAKRELFEEADLRADTWHTLADQALSPGGSSERLRIYLARDVTEIAEDERFARFGEEADMPSRWVDLPEAVAAVQDGRVTNATAATAILLCSLAVSQDFARVRPADAPWPV